MNKLKTVTNKKPLPFRTISIELTLRQLVSAQDAIREVESLRWPGLVSLAWGRLTDILIPHLERFEKERIKVVQNYGLDVPLDENAPAGQQAKRAKEQAAAAGEIDEMLDKPFFVDITPVQLTQESIERVGDIKPVVFRALGFAIEFESEGESEKPANTEGG